MKRRADGDPLCMEEGVGHGAADDEAVDPPDQVGEDRELGRDLGAADDGDDRPLGRLQCLAERLQLRLHEAPCRTRQALRQGGGGGVGAMRGREGVVDVKIGECGEGIGEGRIVRLLARVEAQVLQQRHVAGRERSCCGLRLLADAIGDESHRAAAQRLRKRFGEGTERHRRHGLALRPAKVRSDDDLRPTLCEFCERRRHSVDPRGVADCALPHRHVQVHPHEDALAGDLDIVERAERGHGARGCAVSDASRKACSVTTIPDELRHRPSGSKNPIRCRTRRARGRACHRPRRSGRHRGSSFPADG